jgi:hypothetical protein
MPSKVPTIPRQVGIPTTRTRKMIKYFPHLFIVCFVSASRQSSSGTGILVPQYWQCIICSGPPAYSKLAPQLVQVKVCPMIIPFLRKRINFNLSGQFYRDLFHLKNARAVRDAAHVLFLKSCPVKVIIHPLLGQ